MEKIKISPESEEYVQAVESARESFESEGIVKSKVFGSDFIKNINSLRQKNAPEEKINEAIEESRMQLLRLIDENGSEYLGEIFKGSFSKIPHQNFENNSNYQAIVDFFWGDDEDEDAEEKAKSAINILGGKFGGEFDEIDTLKRAIFEFMPTEMYERFIRLHIEEFEKNFKDFAEKCPAWLKELTDKVEIAVKDGKLPLDIEVAKKRLSETDIVFSDYFNPDLPHQGGSIKRIKNQVLIQTYHELENPRHVLIHELWHLLSGSTLIAQKGEVIDAEEIRDGLHFGFPNQKISKMKHSHFSWLNEAITETLAEEFAGDKVLSYDKEREALHYFLNAGKKQIGMDIVLNAYFENYDPKKGTPKWKELLKQIGDAYEPGFLQKIDQRYWQGAEGVKNAIKEWENK
jgi:hypothetical protein